MNKSQLADKSRKIGLEVAKLINEYRNSSGETVSHDESYYSEFFAGVITFLCTGNGTVELEYDADPKYNIIYGTVIHEGPIQHTLPAKYIDTEMSVTEKVEISEGKPAKSYSHSMDPITYMELFSRTDLGGNPILGHRKVIRGES